MSHISQNQEGMPIRSSYGEYTQASFRRNTIDANSTLVIMPAMVRQHLSRFESLARRVIEGSVGRTSENNSLTFQIATSLAEALDRYENEADLPRIFRVVVNPSDLANLAMSVDELDQWLTRQLSSLSNELGVIEQGRASVRVVTDDVMSRGDITLETVFDVGAGDTTNVFDLKREVGMESLRRLDAFLIVNGRRHVALNRPLMTIGRRIDNDVIIDSPVISRQHAHIRWQHGRFVLYDVGSRGGIQLNGKRIMECVLAPGDLITLSERIPLIYGEGQESRTSIRSREDQGSQDTMAYAPEDE